MRKGIDLFLDEYNDWRTLYELFGDEKYKWQMNDALMRLQLYIKHQEQLKEFKSKKQVQKN